MSGRESKHSVERRILLHLLKYSKAYGEAWEVPHAISQEGIGEALDILLNNVSRAIKGLKVDDKVEERLVHIKGVKRRRKAYFLTLDGASIANQFKDEIQKVKIGFVGKNGVPTELPIEKVKAQFKLDFGISLSASEVLETERRNGVFDCSKVSSQLKAKVETDGEERKRTYVDLTDNAPRLVDFVGRDGIVTRIEQCIDGPGPPVIVVHGMAGIGKTSVALRVIEGNRGQRHVFYYRLHSWDSNNNIAASLQDLLTRMGCRTKQVSVMRGLDVNELAMLLIRELASKPVLLVFDDFQKAREGVLPLFRLLTDLSGQFRGLRLLVISRTVPNFYSRRDVTVNKVVEEIHLDVLDIDETRELLGEDYGEEALERIYRLSRGVPLFLEILNSVENVDAIGDIQKYVEEEIYSELVSGERKVLENLSVHRYPVPAEAVLVDGTSFDDLSALCRRSLVMELPHRRFEAHDLVKEFVYGRLSPDARRKCHSRAGKFYYESIEERDPLDDLYYSSELASVEAVHHMQAAGDVQSAANLLLKAGPDLLAHGYSEVKDLLEAIKKSDVDMTTWADILLQRGDAAVVEEDWSSALENYTDALKAKKRLGAGRATLAAIHGMIGRVLMKVERWEETISSHKDALRMFEEAGDDRGMAKELINLGVVYRNRRDWKKAKTSYKKAKDILEELGDITGLVVLHNNLALLNKGQGDLRESERDIAKAIKLADSVNDEMGKAMVIFTRGELRSTMGDIKAARRDYENAATIFRKNRAFDPAIRIYMGLGDLLLEEGMTALAMKAFLKALDLYQFNKGRRVSLFRRRRVTEAQGTLGNIYDRLSSVFRAKGDLQEAIRYDTKAMDCYDGEGNRSAVARKLLDMGLAHEDLGRLKESWTCMERALEYLSDSEDHRGMAAIRLNLTRICIARSDRTRARIHAEQVKKIAEKLGDGNLRELARTELQRLGKTSDRGKRGPRKKKT